MSGRERSLPRTHLLEPITVNIHALLFPLNLPLAVHVSVWWQVWDQKLFSLARGVANVLVVVKNGVEAVETVGSQQPDRGNHVGHRPRGEGAAGETNENDVVAIDIIGADEIVDLANVLVKSHAECAAGELIQGVGGAHAGKVIDDLGSPVGACPPEDA